MGQNIEDSMEKRTLEKVLRARNTKLTVWILIPMMVSYGVLQGLLLWNELRLTQKRIYDWEKLQTERLSQSLFLKNEADLREAVLSPGRSQEFREPLTVGIWDAREKLIATNGKGWKSPNSRNFSTPFEISLREGTVTSHQKLFLGDKFLGYLRVQSKIDYKEIFQPSLILAIYCFLLVLILKLGVYFLMFTLRRTIVKPLQKITEEVGGGTLVGLKELKPLRVEDEEYQSAPSEISDFIERYNLLVNKIQELREKENALLVASAKLEMAEQIAHDIRSPITALSLAIEDLTELPQKQKQIFFGVIDRMTGIANELLTKERIVSPQIVDLKPVIETLVEEKKIILGKSSLIQIQCRDLIDVKAIADESDLKRALSNLIDNAREAITGDGLIEIKLSSSQGVVYLSVKDNGKGIAKEDFMRVWDPGVTIGKNGGHGLGLSFVKSVVESWGGRVTLDSAPGKGTVMSLKLKRFDG
jgi:signal transduction histidine kinase